MTIADSLRYAVRVLGYGVGILHEPPPIATDPEIEKMRQVERDLRTSSLLLARDLRTDNLARLQKRLSKDA